MSSSLKSTDKLFVNNEYFTQINLHIDSYFLGVIRKPEKDSKLVSVSTKFHLIIRDFFALKLNILRSFRFTKVDAHQDDINSLDQLNFLEKLNFECDTIEKKL